MNPTSQQLTNSNPTEFISTDVSNHVEGQFPIGLVGAKGVPVSVGLSVDVPTDGAGGAIGNDKVGEMIFDKAVDKLLSKKPRLSGSLGVGIYATSGQMHTGSINISASSITALLGNSAGLLPGSTGNVYQAPDPKALKLDTIKVTAINTGLGSSSVKPPPLTPLQQAQQAQLQHQKAMSDYWNQLAISRLTDDTTGAAPDGRDYEPVVPQ